MQTGGAFRQGRQWAQDGRRAYNSAAGALESRVLVSGRKFMALGVQSPSTLQELEPVEVSVRQLQSPEMAEAVVDLVTEPSHRLSDGEVSHS